VIEVRCRTAVDGNKPTIRFDKAGEKRVLESGFIRFFGKVELIESGPVRDRIFSLLAPSEQTHVGADTGIGALVKIEKALDARGKTII